MRRPHPARHPVQRQEGSLRATVPPPRLRQTHPAPPVRSVHPARVPAPAERVPPSWRVRRGWEVWEVGGAESLSLFIIGVIGGCPWGAILPQATKGAVLPWRTPSFVSGSGGAPMNRDEHRRRVWRRGAFPGSPFLQRHSAFGQSGSRQKESGHRRIPVAGQRSGGKTYFLRRMPTAPARAHAPASRARPMPPATGRLPSGRTASTTGSVTNTVALSGMFSSQL